MRSFFLFCYFRPNKSSVRKHPWSRNGNPPGPCMPPVRGRARCAGKSFPFRGAIIGTKFPQWDISEGKTPSTIRISLAHGVSLERTNTHGSHTLRRFIALSHKLCYLIICLPFYLTTDWLAGRLDGSLSGSWRRSTFKVRHEERFNGFRLIGLIKFIGEDVLRAPPSPPESGPFKV